MRTHYCGELNTSQNDEIVEPLSERITGRTALYDVYAPASDELLVEAGELRKVV